MNSFNLGGHSGCLVYLIEPDDGMIFVRKTSKDLDYNERMKAQCEKQANYKGTFIRTPKVLRRGYTDDGLFFFDMEYIQGITLSEYIKTMEIGKIRGLVEALVASIIPEKVIIPTEQDKEYTRSIFANKFSTLRMQLKEKENVVINQALDLLERHDFSKMVLSQCHGDMTLENIIVKNDQLYFIDFLDSFYDSWFLDIGTLLQDVQVMWSYRKQSNISMNTVLRLIVFRDLLLDSIEAVNKEYTLEIYYALLQKLIRIYPYTKDELTYDFLNAKTSLVINKILSLEEKDGAR